MRPANGPANETKNGNFTAVVPYGNKTGNLISPLTKLLSFNIRGLGFCIGLFFTDFLCCLHQIYIAAFKLLARRIY